MKHIIFSLLVSISSVGLTFGQNSQKIAVLINTEQKKLNIQQHIVFHNTTNDTLNSIYLYDWNQAYSGKNTPLAKRFAEDFNKSLHLAKEKDRGYTEILSLVDKNFGNLSWERTKPTDIIKVQLNYPIYPNQHAAFSLTYTVKLPKSNFTDYGFTDEGNFNLRYWYITPAVYDGEWKLYSNKNLDDLYSLSSDCEVDFTFPEEYNLITDLDEVNSTTNNGRKKITLKGENRSDLKIFLIKNTNRFSRFINRDLTLITDIESKDLNDITLANSANKVVRFIEGELGTYPNQKILVSEIEYRKNPLYGLNQLPSFIRPFKDEFQFELKLLKTLLKNYLDNTLLINPREERWVNDAIQTYLLMKYVDEYYPDMKLIGNLSKIWGIRSFHLAKMDFNEQYTFLYMLMARKNLSQALDTQSDSLIKFNEKIANKYKAGVGLAYLSNYLEENHIDNAIKAFYNSYKGKKVSASDFEHILKSGASKDIDWFFSEYIKTNKQIDYKISKVEKDKDSLFVTIKNKTRNNAPITLYSISRKDSVLSKSWLSDITDEKTITLPRDGAHKLVLNYDGSIPEFNQRDNWKSVGGFLSSNKRVKFQFFKDAEDPYFNQIFFVPVATFNFYDGFTGGLRFYNKTFLSQPFVYDVRPSFGFKENSFVGSGVVAYRKYFKNNNLYLINYAISGSSYHYAPNLRYSTITPSVSFNFRGNDLRSNEREALLLRFVNVIRDNRPGVVSNPDYSVFNSRYVYSNTGIINHFTWFIDGQVANKFAKLSVNADYRKLFQNNMQLNLRFFAGKFIYNDTTSDYFSFALDRPTDYLFDYNYLGRSENDGIFSQQFIMAEGGFKSRLENPYANDWISTMNASFNVYKWIELYGDVGFIKDKGHTPYFVYDSGIRLNLVPDYFELYFPVYSKNGWEIGQERYDQKIRFVVTLSPRTLIGLFTRKWF